MLFVYTQKIYFSAWKWLKRVFGCLARLCPEFRASLQISSENLLGHQVTSQALEAVVSVMVLMACDNVEHWEPEYGTSFKSAISKFYSSSQLPNDRFLSAPHINAFKFWPLAILCSLGFLSSRFPMVETVEYRLGLYTWLGTFRRDVSVPSDCRCSQHLCPPWQISSEAAWVGGLLLLRPVVGQGGLL